MANARYTINIGFNQSEYDQVKKIQSALGVTQTELFKTALAHFADTHMVREAIKKLGEREEK